MRAGRTHTSILRQHPLYLLVQPPHTRERRIRLLPHAQKHRLLHLRRVRKPSEGKVQRSQMHPIRRTRSFGLKDKHPGVGMSLTEPKWGTERYEGTVAGTESSRD